MKIEAGKFYKTRDGRKAFVTGTRLGNPFSEDVTKSNKAATRFPFHGVVQSVNAEMTWTSKGSAIGEDVLHVLDLVAEWEETPANPMEPLNQIEYYEAIVRLGESTFIEHATPSREAAEAFLQSYKENGLATRIIKVTEFRSVVETTF